MTATDWGTGPDSTKAVQFWRDPLVVDHYPADGAAMIPADTIISVQWSVPMEPDTDFVVEGPAGVVSGTFGYDSNTQTVTFTPDAALDPGTAYTVTIADAVSVGVPGGDAGTLQSPVSFSFTTARLVDVTFEATVPDYTPGTVFITGNLPEFGSWNPGYLALTQVDEATWSTTLSLYEGTHVVYKFTRGSWETVEKQADGNGEISDRTLTVEYGSGGTQTAASTVENWRDPIVVSHSPMADAAGVAVDSVITVTWNQAMLATTAFEVSGGGGPIAGSFSYDPASYTVTFTSDSLLAVDTIYTVAVSGQVDVAGDAQQVDKNWSFMTVTPREAIEDLMEDVEALGAGGVINDGQVNSLLVKLDRATNQLDTSKDKQAVNQLYAFISEVESLIAEGMLPADEGQVLIDQAMLIIQAIELD